MIVYFSDIFGVDPDILELYGAFNVALINDLPLFIDPFLLFNSEKPEYRALHESILMYVAFLRDKSIETGLRPGLLKAWFYFSEVKQNWLGYSLVGNEGSGLGRDFALALHNNLHTLFTDFGEETITESSHLEKLCLVKNGVGRDNISDFTTNLIKEYLLEYTQAFAAEHIDPSLRRDFAVQRVRFNYDTGTWISANYNLPEFNGDYVLLTPKDMLTKDETWINKADIFGNFYDIVNSVTNEELRDQMNYYFVTSLPPPKKKKKGKGTKAPTAAEIAEAVRAVIRKFPEFIDYYIRFKEEHGDEAKSISEERVLEVQNLFIDKLSYFIQGLADNSDFYETLGDTLDEARARVEFLKNVIENKDGYRLFYVQGKPVKRESDVQIMFRLTWYATRLAVTREANEGRGPADFLIARGAKDKSLVEFKLASNFKLRQNLQKQLEIYKAAHDTDKGLKVILYFSAEEEKKVKDLLVELGLDNDDNIILIDARNDNKPSASNA